MRVFKFGGASVNNADAVKNVADIITRFSNEELVLVFSAMGKTTNALEKVTHAAFYNLPELTERIDEVENFHFNIADALFDSDHLQINNKLKNIFDSLKQVASKPEYAYDEFYDRIVSFGEILSTTIISRFLNERGIMNVIIPAQEMIIT
jgi:aspartate kinase